MTSNLGGLEDEKGGGRMEVIYRDAVKRKGGGGVDGSREREGRMEL